MASVWLPVMLLWMLAAAAVVGVGIAMLVRKKALAGTILTTVGTVMILAPVLWFVWAAFVPHPHDDVPQEAAVTATTLA